MRGSGGAALAIALLVTGAPARAQEPAGRVVLRWQAVAGAVGYDLQVSRDANFGQRELEVRVDLAGYRLPPPRDGRRFWRVRAVDADGRPGSWSAAKVIEPLPSTPEPGAPPPEPELRLLEVPPLRAAEVALLAGAPVPAAPAAPSDLPAPRVEEDVRPPAPPAERGLEGFTVIDVLRDGRPGLLLGWRANLLGVDAPELTVEGSFALPWLGARWCASLRGGWWRTRATVAPAAGLASALHATADVLPIQAFLVHRVPIRWGLLYAGAGAGLQLVVIRLPDEGALDVSGALTVLAGTGRRVGPGELFGELSAGIGGVEGPLGRLRTGGISLAVGYRLWK